MSDNIGYSHSGDQTETPTAHAKSPYLDVETSYVTHGAGDDAPPRAPVSQLGLGLVILVVWVVAAAGVGQIEAPERKAESNTTTVAPMTAPAPAPAVATTGAPPGPASGESHAVDIKDFKSQLDGMSAQLKALQVKLEALPKPEPVPDLKPIEGKLDDLKKSLAMVGPLTEKVGVLDDSVKKVNDEVSGLTTEIKKLAAGPAPAEKGPTFSEGVELFKARKFKEAADLFKKLEATSPDDARVYYYEAFANALATKDWNGAETARLGTKGATLEKAGTTKPDDVNAAFADLPASLKPWLTHFRSLVK